MAATATLLTRDIQGESLSGVTDRLANTALIYEGVIMRNNANSFQVKQNLGTDMNVKIGSLTAFDRAVIQGDLAGQGVFITEHQNASQVLSIAASDPTNDRIDIVILRIYDDTFDSSGFEYADLEVITGTPSGSPVVPTVPAGSFVLAEILVQNAVTQIVNGDITDKRVEAPRHGELVKTIYYTANDTFTKADHPWLHKIRVRLVAGGGGGGGTADAGSGQIAAAGGGGGGGYSEKEILESALGATETVTVDGGGAGGAAGLDGVAGGPSSFGSFLSATGGGLGKAGPAKATWAMRFSGVGGVGSGGDLNSDGEPGSAGMHGASADFFLQPGVGGASRLGQPGRHTDNDVSSVGPAGKLYGSGGGGSYARDPIGALAGGNGAAGIVIVDLYA